MIHALLKGKLSREQEKLEDALISNVFGLFRLLPGDEDLFKILSKAIGPLAATSNN